MATREAMGQLQHEVCLRLARGEKVNDLADEYGVTRMTIWRWNNQATAEAMPHMDDREEWREELTGVISEALQKACEAGDDKAIVSLIDRLAKLNGLDHTHRVQEAHLQLHAAQVTLMADTMKQALETAGVSLEQRREVLELIAHANG